IREGGIGRDAGAAVDEGEEPELLDIGEGRVVALHEGIERRAVGDQRALVELDRKPEEEAEVGLDLLVAVDLLARAPVPLLEGLLDQRGVVDRESRLAGELALRELRARPAPEGGVLRMDQLLTEGPDPEELPPEGGEGAGAERHLDVVQRRLDRL